MPTFKNISCLVATLSLAFLVTPTLAQYSVGPKAAVRRERNLDFWDSDTLAYFLDEYPGYDAAVMFYAQWDQNSHSLAPYWDRIGTMMEAGSSRSRLVMALFDCESNVANSQLCEAVGVTYYPTLMFIGSGPYHDSDPVTKTIFGTKRAVGMFGEAPVPNTVKFQGNWQYPDSILDWIRAMQALSNWHAWSTKGFGKRLRNLFLPQKKEKSTPLPVGIPGSSKSGPSSSSSSSSSDVVLLESMVEALSNKTSDLEKIVLRSTIMLETILLPSSDNDVYSQLSKEGVWTDDVPNTPLQEVLKNCVLEVSLDYCQRVGSKAATDLVDMLEKQGLTYEQMIAMESLEDDVIKLVEKDEPFCVILDACVIGDMKDEKCRPSTCPFKNAQACNYLKSCLEPEIQQEYADALGLKLPGSGLS